MENTNKTTRRESSFELLRIITMFSILICHFATHGGFEYDPKTISLPRLWWYLIEMGGNFGTNVFVILSGYFLINDKNSGLFKINRILRFWGQVFFYSVMIYGIFTIIGINQFSVISFIKSLFPITYNEWWFASTYFVLYLVHPFLNIFLKNLKKEQFQIMLLLLFAIWCLIPTFLISSYQSNHLLWFITLYCLAAYIRLYGLNTAITLKHNVILFGVFSLLRYLSAMTIIVIGTRITSLAKYSLGFYRAQSVLTVITALSFFMIFKSININYNKWINRIASASFGVYLIHENPIIRPFLWAVVFKNASYQDSMLLIPYSIIVAILVYAVGTLIDLTRQATIERAFLTVLDKHIKNIEVKTSSIVKRTKYYLFGDKQCGDS